MICPRCSVGEISESSQECLVCGYSPTGGVVVEAPAWNDLEDPSVRSLERQFRVEGVLRRGTVSSVYLARDTVSGRLTALKVLPLALQHSHDLPERFKAEAALAAALDHPHVVPVYHFGVSDACLWYTMEYCQTRSLGELLRASGPIELRACLRLVEQVASALDYGHRRGVLHGNLKLSNVLVDADGWARVTDFGMLTALGPLPPRRPDASIEENYGHVAPERFGASPIFGPASDQYSLAVLTYACLAGRQPITGDSVDEIARGHVQGATPRLSDARASVPPHVTAAAGRGMSKTPAGRFPTILDYSTALAGVGLPRYSPLPMPMPVPETPRRTPAPGATPLLMVEGDPDEDLPPIRSTPRRRRWLRWVAATLTIAVVGVGYWWWRLPQTEPPRTANLFQTSAPLGPNRAIDRAPVDSPAPAPAPIGSTTGATPAGSTTDTRSEAHTSQL